MAFRGGIAMACALVCAALWIPGACAQSNLLQDYSVGVDVRAGWNATGIMLAQGDEVILHATGLFKPNAGGAPGNWYHWLGPDGGAGGASASFLAPGLAVYSLVGRVGPVGEPFWIGRFRAFRADTQGELFLALNDKDFGDNQGTLGAYVWLRPGNSNVLEPAAQHRSMRAPEATGHPTPFEAGTSVAFSLLSSGAVEVAIFDAEGRRVRVLNLGACTAGRHIADWDGCDESGSAVPAGVYYCRVTSNGTNVKGRLISVR